MRRFLYFLLFTLCISNHLFSQSKKTLKLHKKATKNLQEWHNPLYQWNHVGAIKIDTFSINPDERSIEFQFSTSLSYLPIREENYTMTINSIQESLGRKFKDYNVIVKTSGQSLEALIPNYYRKSIEIDPERINPYSEERIPIVRRLSDEIPASGLFNTNIALWHSHGLYYEATLDRWEWQRARLYSTVEDIFPLTFVLPYLTPMLENAGANVFLPRERDTQKHEVIVDNDRSTKYSTYGLSNISSIDTLAHGFLLKDTLFVGDNPFLMGTSLKYHATDKENEFMRYVPFIPENGDYAVYISFIQAEDNISNAKYIVYHTGGKTEFSVNQKIGGGTWIYLGTFNFSYGRNASLGSVLLSMKSEEDGWISADAVKFGGGMGNVARKPADEILPNQKSLNAGSNESIKKAQKFNPDQIDWKMSQRPRYQEGARYYLQYAGVPDSLVYSLNEGKNDYNDDYQSRGEWVNYLLGAPNGPNENRNALGLNIPIDLSLAFHTDAGVTPKDTIIGTLGIYSSIRDDGKFPNGQSKMANRDLTDIIQSEIVHDIRAQFNQNWSRRGLWDKEYSEAWRPNVPAMLLELLSHQNLTDMSYGHDPRFKFAVSRSIYKGMVKYLAFQNGSKYVIQPLPVDHFSIKHIGTKTIQLSWEPVIDSLEKSAVPTKYKIYQRIGDAGFDNGMLVSGKSIDIEVDEWETIYSYKVTAINAGGESFPSEILSVGFTDNDKNPVLVINCFDRVSAPEIIDVGNFAGLAFWEDEGVPDKFNVGYTGQQYDYDRNSIWLDDDSPGWGASYGDMEGKLIPGNSFDNTMIHGSAILNAGYSFISISDEAFSIPDFNIDSYEKIDLIYGEEKTTKTLSGNLFKVFDSAIQNKITEFTRKGGNVFATGAYIGSDHILNKDTIAQKFANEVLHFKWRTNHAVRTGEVYSTDQSNKYFNGQWIFNTSFHPTIYKVEAPDAIEAMGEDAFNAFRYGENNASAGTAFKGKYKTVILGCPFETILDEGGRNLLMKQVLDFFE